MAQDTVQLVYEGTHKAVELTALNDAVFERGVPQDIERRLAETLAKQRGTWRIVNPGKVK